MVTANEKVVDGVMRQGNVMYVYDNTNKHSYPALGDTTGRLFPAQREPFIFRPGASALASTSAVTGMVLSGVRTGSPTVASTSANVTVWGTEIVYAPLRSGKIDGITTGGTISGQITIGSIAAAATCLAKHTLRIRNTTGASTALTTCLFLSGTVAVGATTEVYTTYTINHLQTTANFNSVPFGIALGVQSNEAGTAAVCRIMENSYIQGEFEPTA